MTFPRKKKTSVCRRVTGSATGGGLEKEVASGPGSRWEEAKAHAEPFITEPGRHKASGGKEVPSEEEDDACRATSLECPGLPPDAQGVPRAF